MGFFSSKQEKIAERFAQAMGGTAEGMTPITEAAEWAQNLKPDDPRREKVPPKYLEGDYYLVSTQREMGQVVRVTPKEAQIRLPFQMKLKNGLKIPSSHLLRAIPIEHFFALGDQRSQKVIIKILQLAGETYREHQRMCKTCFKLVEPPHYPGHPNKGILGPPANKLVECDACKLKKVKAKEALEAEAIEAAKVAYTEEQKRLRELNKM